MSEEAVIICGPQPISDQSILKECMHCGKHIYTQFSTILDAKAQGYDPVFSCVECGLPGLFEHLSEGGGLEPMRQYQFDDLAKLVGGKDQAKELLDRVGLKLAEGVT